MITKEEYASYKVKYTRQAEEIKAAITALKETLKDVLENKSERNRWISHFTQFESMETLDRKALIFANFAKTLRPPFGMPIFMMGVRLIYMLTRRLEIFNSLCKS